MKKRFIYLAIPAMAIMTSFKTKDTAVLCHYSAIPISANKEMKISPAAGVALERVHSVLNVVGLKPNFSVYSSSIGNASAMISGRSRYIMYNPDFMQSVRDAAGANWTSYSIMAHEIGHHLNGHTLHAGGSNHAIELEADEFSGFVLRKMGATLPEAQAAIKLISSDHSSATHPGRASRLKAIAKGWHKADEQLSLP